MCHSIVSYMPMWFNFSHRLTQGRLLQQLLNRIVAVQVSDTTGDDSSTVAGYQITFFFQ